MWRCFSLCWGDLCTWACQNWFCCTFGQQRSIKISISREIITRKYPRAIGRFYTDFPWRGTLRPGYIQLSPDHIWMMFSDWSSCHAGSGCWSGKIPLCKRDIVVLQEGNKFFSVKSHSHLAGAWEGSKECLGISQIPWIIGSDLELSWGF